MYSRCIVGQTCYLIYTTKRSYFPWERNDFYGNDLITSIKIFNTFLSKNNIKNENLLLVKDYAMKAFEKYKTDLGI